jgi:hypothetical protein
VDRPAVRCKSALTFAHPNQRPRTQYLDYDTFDFVQARDAGLLAALRLLCDPPLARVYTLDDVDRSMQYVAKSPADEWLHYPEMRLAALTLLVRVRQATLDAPAPTFALAEPSDAGQSVHEDADALYDDTDCEGAGAGESEEDQEEDERMYSMLTESRDESHEIDSFFFFGENSRGEVDELEATQDAARTSLKRKRASEEEEDALAMMLGIPHQPRGSLCCS